MYLYLYIQYIDICGEGYWKPTVLNALPSFLLFKSIYLSIYIYFENYTSINIINGCLYCWCVDSCQYAGKGVYNYPVLYWLFSMWQNKFISNNRRAYLGYNPANWDVMCVCTPKKCAKTLSTRTISKWPLLLEEIMSKLQTAFSPHLFNCKRRWAAVHALKFLMRTI